MKTSRRTFLSSVSLLVVASTMRKSAFDFRKKDKLRVVLVGTVIRGSSLWGKRLVSTYPDILKFAGLFDSNPGRLRYAQEYMGITCPLYSDFD